MFYYYRITEILEERGWSRTKDHDITNFTMKWCLEHQVDWEKFKEGKQLINNIPGQITFADKVNLWYTIRDYLNNRRNAVGNYIQTFLPMTFVLDDEDEVAEFLRVFKSKAKLLVRLHTNVLNIQIARLYFFYCMCSDCCILL